MQFKKRRELKRTRIEIIPMIDTIFFLLVFFMLSSLALTRLNGLRVDLPQTRNAPAQKSSEITVSIDKTRQIFVNRQSVSEANLSAVLQRMIGEQKVDVSNTTIIINADQIVPHGIVVRCIDQAREIGIVHFAIATREVATREQKTP